MKAVATKPTATFIFIFRQPGGHCRRKGEREEHSGKALSRQMHPRAFLRAGLQGDGKDKSVSCYFILLNFIYLFPRMDLMTTLSSYVFSERKIPVWWE